MAVYKEMYLRMARASEQAINILIEAQRECEELYISASEPILETMGFQQGTEKSADGT